MADEDEAQARADEARTDAWLHAPTLVPTGGVHHMKDDPTFVAWEPQAAPRGPTPKLPFRFQCLAPKILEDPFSRPSDVADFRQGVFRADHYKACAADHTRPRGGRVFLQDVQARRRFNRDATSYMRLTGRTPSGHEVAVFVRHRFSVTVRQPLKSTDAVGMPELDTWVRKMLRLRPVADGGDPEQVRLHVFKAFPLMGWHMHRQHWLRIEVDNETLQRSLMSSLRKAGEVLGGCDKPMTEQLKAMFRNNMHAAAHIQVVGGRIVPLSHQGEHVDVEVHDAEIRCLQSKFTDHMPSMVPQRLLSFDFEAFKPHTNNKMVQADREEVRLNMVSVVLQDFGTPTPYNHAEEMVMFRQHPEDNKKEEEGTGGGTGPGAGRLTKAKPAVDWSQVDLRVAEDTVHLKAVGSKKQKKKKKRDAEDMKDDTSHVARFLISMYPVPPSPAYTLILVRDELEMVQAIRRLRIRFRASARVSHNGDEFDSTAWRQKVILHTQPEAPTLWFFDHPIANTREHQELRRRVHQPRMRQQAALVHAAWLERKNSGYGREDEAEPPKEVAGIWAPPSFHEAGMHQVIAFNLWLAWRELPLSDTWMHGTGLPAAAAAWRGILEADTATAAALRATRQWPGNPAPLVCAWHVAVPKATHGGRVVRRVCQYLGLRGITLPHPLDAEFLDTDASTPCAFVASSSFSKQRGTTFSAHYHLSTCVEIDTLVMARQKFPKDKNGLGVLAPRLGLPTKIEMPFTRMNRFGVELRDACWNASRGGTRLAPTPAAAQADEATRGVMTNALLVGVYCVFDSVLPLKILEKTKAVPEVFVMAWITSTSPDSVFRRGINYRNGTLVASFSTECGFVVNVRRIPYDGNVEGARVPVPVTGFWDKGITASVDVNSLYPSIMEDSNLCWSTLILDPEEMRNAVAAGLDMRHYHFHGRDYYFVQYTKDSPYMRRGLLGRIMEYLITTRKATKKAMKKCRNPVERTQLDIKQQALKLLANSMYGYTGFEQSPLSALVIAAAITSDGRGVNREMERCINEDFTMPRLKVLRPLLCKQAGVPEYVWALDEHTPVMKGLGGDTDSIFLQVPMLDGDPKKLLVLRHVYTLREAPEGYDAAIDGPLAYDHVLEVLEDKASPVYATAVRRFHNRRAATVRQRQAARDTRDKLVKAAKASQTPMFWEAEAVTERTCVSRVAFALVDYITEHMGKNCFNARAHKTGRRSVGIGTDYIARKLLLLKKKNYALLMWEDDAALEDDDYYPKQSGLPSVKGDTPLVIRTMFRDIVIGLQTVSQQKARAVLRGTCEAILADRVPVSQYAKRVKLGDPRNMASPETTSQTNLYMRMVEREQRGELNGTAVPEIGAYLPMLLTWNPQHKGTDAVLWETPAYMEAFPQRFKVDRVHYLNMIVKKMQYLCMPDMVRIAEEYKLRCKLQQERGKVERLGGGGAAGGGTSSGVQAHLAKVTMRTQARNQRKKIVPLVARHKQGGGGTGAGADVRAGSFQHMRMQRNRAKMRRRTLRQQGRRTGGAGVGAGAGAARGKRCAMRL